MRNDRRSLTVLTASTSCRSVSPLHFCAEFNSIRCGKLLIDSGADVNACALVAAAGFGGQTPIFHAVNSRLNYCRPMMELLVPPERR
jgi:ankyrin repeat protein